MRDGEQLEAAENMTIMMFVVWTRTNMRNASLGEPVD